MASRNGNTVDVRNFIWGDNEVSELRVRLGLRKSNYHVDIETTLLQFYKA